MPVLAYQPERLAALQRSVDDLEFALSHLRQSIPPELSFLWVSIEREMALCRAQQEIIVGVLRSDVENVRHWSGSAVADHGPDNAPHNAPHHAPNSAQWAKNRLLAWVNLHPSWWAKATHGHPTDIDSTLRSLRSNPPAAAAFIDSLTDVAPLIYGAHDTDLVRAFWLQVTNPETTSPEIAGRRIQSLLTTIFGDHTWSSGLSRSSINPVERRRIEQAAIDMLGEILAPWQFNFSGQAALWSWSSSTGINWLRTVATSSKAAADLALGLGPSVVRSLSHLPASPPERYRQIDEVAFSIGASLEILHESGQLHAGRDQPSWQSLDQLIDLAPVNAPWPLSILVGRGASWLDERLLTRHQSPTEHRQRQQATLTSQQVLAGLAVLTVWRSHWKSPSRLRPAFSPRQIERELQHTYDAIDAPSARGRIMAR